MKRLFLSLSILSAIAAQADLDALNILPEAAQNTQSVYEVDGIEMDYCEVCGYAHPHKMTRQQAQALFDSITIDPAIAEYYAQFPPFVNEPLVYSGYRSLRRPKLTPEPPVFTMDARKQAYDADRYAGILYSEEIDPSELEEGDEVLIIQPDSTLVTGEFMLEEVPEPKDIPDWLAIGLRAQRINSDLQYQYMVTHPLNIDYAYWDLPEPPSLPEEDHSFAAFLKSLDLPDIDQNAEVLPEFERGRINWLHRVGGALQFSQAYISSNWYQGGNNYFALLFNANWNIELNTTYHPNLLFQSDLGYKLAINSNTSEALHKFSISQDLFQYNLKMGVKAFKKWFYSFNLQFKTQLFNSYPSDSPNLGAAFLSPADLNIGLGMTYNLSKFKDRLKFAASISPISYNLKTCISDRIDHMQFNIAADRHTASEIGSNAELTLTWDITSNISWKSRLFLFTDYHYFLADWENSFNFTINKFLSTQLYLHPRFDSSSDFNVSKWHYWSLKEILSFGLSYTFSTKP